MIRTNGICTTLEIRQKAINEQNTNTVSDTLGFDKQEQSNRNEHRTLENRTPPPNNREQTLTQELKIHLENSKRIMNEQKTILPQLRKIEWRTIKMDTEKMNQLEEINQKLLAKEGRLKKYRQRVKQHRQNRTFQSNERKFYQQVEEDETKTYQQPDARETGQFWSKIW